MFLHIFFYIFFCKDLIPHYASNLLLGIMNWTTEDFFKDYFFINYSSLKISKIWPHIVAKIYPLPHFKEDVALQLQELTWIPFTQKVVVPTLVKIGLVVLKKTMKLGKYYYRQQQILIRKAHLILGSGELKIIQKCMLLISANKLKSH